MGRRLMEDIMKRERRSFAFGFAILMAWSLRTAAVRAFDNPCSGSNHGIYPSVFCAGDSMTGAKGRTWFPTMAITGFT